MADNVICPMRGSRDGLGVRKPPPPENHIAIGFLSNTGLDDLKSYKPTKPAINVWPSLARQRNAI